MRWWLRHYLNHLCRHLSLGVLDLPVECVNFQALELEQLKLLYQLGIKSQPTLLPLLLHHEHPRLQILHHLRGHLHLKLHGFLRLSVQCRHLLLLSHLLL